VYGNAAKTWIVGSFYSSCKKRLLDEFLHERVLQKFVENSKMKTIKENEINKNNDKN